jgi:hypothetical protein
MVGAKAATGLGGRRCLCYWIDKNAYSGAGDPVGVLPCHNMIHKREDDNSEQRFRVARQKESARPAHVVEQCPILAQK